MIFDLDGVFHSLPVKPGDVSTISNVVFMFSTKYFLLSILPYAKSVFSDTLLTGACITMVPMLALKYHLKEFVLMCLSRNKL